ncbi:uncharacterized protein LOC132719861 [Ruditapes philippinarum]|uniref:uncharacterized protein LOC132719861 n=1 Tax=Ruditapes philippinarum TaxID=129788 RepID=UPI00295B085B|nr:uncharacterized protein LOC132719861 [Ruditapes philippinarum]
MEVLDCEESSCQSCQCDGDTVQAEGYCVNCNEFLCSSCINAHEKLASTKNHVIKSKNVMPKFQIKSDQCTELCDIHDNELVQFYCLEHDRVGCRECILLHHTSCEIQLVSYESCNFNNSDDLLLIKHRLDHLKKNIFSCKGEINSSLKTADKRRTAVVEEIKQFRKEIDNYLDKMEAELIQKVDEVNDRDVYSQGKLQDQCEALLDEIEDYQSKLDQCKNNMSNLFVISKRVQERLQIYQKLNEEISSKSHINTVKFSASEDINALKLNNTCLGHLETQLEKFSGKCKETIFDKRKQFVQKFNVQAKDENDCYITGMTLISDSEILCADNENESLKVLNHREGKITTILKTTTCPRDVTTINSSSAATTLPSEGRILFLNTKVGLTESHSLNVRQGCYGIDHRNGIMAVSFVEPPAVQVINMEGDILHEVRDTGILEFPQFICLNTNNESIFVSDSDNNALYEFTVNKQLKAVNKTDMGPPFGITVTNCGSVFVCYPFKSEMIGVIVPGTTQITHFHIRDALEPTSIIVSEEEQRVFISESNYSEDCNFIKVIDLK